MSKAPKARLSNGQRVVVDDGTGHSPGLGTNEPVVVNAPNKDPFVLRGLRTVIAVGLLGLLLCSAMYVVLALTVMVVMRADGHNVAVLRNQYPVGGAPAGATVYVSSEPVDYSIGGKIKQATSGVPNGSVVQIVGLPGQEVTTTADTVLIDGTQTPLAAGDLEAQRLTRTYLATCVAGACEPGQALLVSQNNVIGGVKGYLTLGGLDKPTIPPHPTTTTPPATATPTENER